MCVRERRGEVVGEGGMEGENGWHGNNSSGRETSI